MKIAIAAAFPKLKIVNGPAFRGITYKPVKNCKRKILPFMSDDTVVIYTESIFGNYLKAKNVVRWLLFYTNMYENPSAYDEHDLFFAYRDVFNVLKVNPTQRRLCVNSFDLDLYKQTNFGDRHGNCYVIRKGQWRKDLPDHFDGPIIDAMSEEEIVATFNRCKKCYCYDTQTAYSAIAALCGCIAIIPLEPGKEKSDYCGPDDVTYGVAYGESEEEIQRALDTVELLRQHFYAFEERNKDNVEKFVQECKIYFNL